MPPRHWTLPYGLDRPNEGCLSPAQKRSIACAARHDFIRRIRQEASTDCAGGGRTARPCKDSFG
jgi:hypothetical protein